MPEKVEKTSSHWLYPVLIPLSDILLEGELSRPLHAKALVILLDEERHKTACRDVAHVLNAHDFATLIISLLTSDERAGKSKHRLQTNIPLLSTRLHKVTGWARHAAETKNFMIGYMAFSGDAAPALIDAARHQDIIGAVVTCDGQTDLAQNYLPYVKRPLLLIACGHDPDNLSVNREAWKTISSPCQLHILTDADSVFSTTKALNEAAQKAAAWFDAYLH